MRPTDGGRRNAAVSSERERTSSFAKTRLTCFSTVFSLTNRVAATCFPNHAKAEARVVGKPRPSHPGCCASDGPGVPCAKPLSQESFVGVLERLRELRLPAAERKERQEARRAERSEKAAQGRAARAEAEARRDSNMFGSGGGAGGGTLGT
jgi:hypothetical protein